MNHRAYPLLGCKDTSNLISVAYSFQLFYIFIEASVGSRVFIETIVLKRFLDDSENKDILACI